MASLANAPTISLSSTNPQLDFEFTNGAADAKRWNWVGSPTTFGIRTLNDAGTTGSNAWLMTRAGNAVTLHQWYVSNVARVALSATNFETLVPHTVVTGTDGNKTWLAKYVSGTGHTDAPKTLGAASTYLQVGGREYGSQGFAGIGFGYVSAATDHPAVWIGHEEIDTAGNTTGDFVVATRNVTTNTPPIEKFRVTKDGDIKAPTAYKPATDQSLVTKSTQSVRVLAQSAVAASHTGNTLNTAVATVTVPANSMGPNGALKITTLWSLTSSANAKTLGIKFGGPSGTSYLNAQLTNSATYREERMIHNRNATNSQVGHSTQATYGGFGVSGGAVVTSTVDTTQDADIVFAVQLNDASETVTLEAYTIELLTP